MIGQYLTYDGIRITPNVEVSQQDQEDLRGFHRDFCELKESLISQGEALIRTMQEESSKRFKHSEDSGSKWNIEALEEVVDKLSTYTAIPLESGRVGFVVLPQRTINRFHALMNHYRNYKELNQTQGEQKWTQH